MRESWYYYKYLRRWGLLLLLGVAVGALAGLGYHSQQETKESFKATATVSIFQAKLSVVSSEFPDPKEAAVSILSSVKLLKRELVGNTGYDIDMDVNDISIEVLDLARYRLWKSIVLGSVVGGLMAIGAAYVWDDARAYLRDNQQNASEDT